MKKLFSILCALLFLGNSLFSQDEPSRRLSDNPTSLKKYVVDETGTLTQSEINLLLKKLQDFDSETSTQIVVYMVESLNGESLEDVSVRIAEANKIGRKDRNNGVLLFIAKGDKKLRIEVGYGLEGVLTDAVSSKIIRNNISPYFRNNYYFEGINSGVDGIIAVAKGEYTNDKSSKKQKTDTGLMCLGIPIFVLIVFGLIFFSIFMSIIRRIFGWNKRFYTGGKGWGGGGFFGGGGGFFGGGGSSGGFGGFSGGGGSFGGGGASGSW
ncbi:MAG: TPM domain-containing protein [Ignavibacteria bacterium]